MDHPATQKSPWCPVLPLIALVPHGYRQVAAESTAGNMKSNPRVFEKRCTWGRGLLRNPSWRASHSRDPDIDSRFWHLKDFQHFKRGIESMPKPIETVGEVRHERQGCRIRMLLCHVLTGSIQMPDLIRFRKQIASPDAGLIPAEAASPPPVDQ